MPQTLLTWIRTLPALVASGWARLLAPYWAAQRKAVAAAPAHRRNTVANLVSYGPPVVYIVGVTVVMDRVDWSPWVENTPLAAPALVYLLAILSRSGPVLATGSARFLGVWFVAIFVIAAASLATDRLDIGLAAFAVTLPVVGLWWYTQILAQAATTGDAEAAALLRKIALHVPVLRLDGMKAALTEQGTDPAALSEVRRTNWPADLKDLALRAGLSEQEITAHRRAGTVPDPAVLEMLIALRTHNPSPTSRLITA